MLSRFEPRMLQLCVRWNDHRTAHTQAGRQATTTTDHNFSSFRSKVIIEVWVIKPAGGWFESPAVAYLSDLRRPRHRHGTRPRGSSWAWPSRRGWRRPEQKKLRASSFRRLATDLSRAAKCVFLSRSKYGFDWDSLKCTLNLQPLINYLEAYEIFAKAQRKCQFNPTY